MTERSPDSARSRLQRASQRLQRAAALLEQTDELKQSIARMRVSATAGAGAASVQPPAEPERRTPTVTLVLGVDGVLRVKKD